MMRNILTAPVESVRLYWEKFLPIDGIAIDATAGNGHDTLFLSRHCQKVYGFDIQEEAIANTRALLEKEGMDNVVLFKASHGQMAEYVKEEVDLVVFNLGYLPNGNHEITTTADETIKALEAAQTLLRENGLISLIIYHGHSQGVKEREAILKWAAQLDSHKWHVVWQKMLNQPAEAPEILLITKKK